MTKDLTLNQYQVGCMRTARYPQELSVHGATFGQLYTCLALAGEAGETANCLKKILRGDFDQKPEMLEAQRNKIIDELGDCLYYVAAAAFEFGVTLESVAKLNQAKLSTRTGIDVQASSLSGSVELPVAST